MIESIRNDIKNGSLNSIISNVIEGEKDYIIQNDDLIYQITSTENQKTNEYNNISTIILGKCEKILKSKYNISENLPLIIFKIDYFPKGYLILIIGYEIYNPEINQKLDLKEYNNFYINISIPVSINEENLLKYDPKNGYYTNKCEPSTTKNGTDILLTDRQNEFNDNNMLLCETNCNYNGYNNKNAECSCGIKYEQIIISQIVDQKNILKYNFTNKNELDTMTCYKTLFTKDGLVKNISSYILLFVLLLLVISGIFFYKCGYFTLEESIGEIINMKEKLIKMDNNNDIDIKETKIRNKKEKERKIFKKKKKKSKRNKNINLQISKNSFSKIELINKDNNCSNIKKQKIIFNNTQPNHNN